MQPLWKYPAACSAAVLVFLLFLSGICVGAVKTPKATSRFRHKASALLAHRHKSHFPAWGYGDLGGNDWANVGYSRCALGDQSPVDLSKMVGMAAPNGTQLFYRYRPYSRAIPLYNDGRLIAWTVQEWRSEEVGHLALGKEYPHDITEYYSLFQVVIHTPSEHTFGGVRVPLELQLYHRKMDLVDGAPKELAEGEAVVAIGFEESTTNNEILSALGSHGAPMATGEEVLGNNENGGGGIDFASLFKKDTSDGGGSGESVAFLEYEGSLTTPPCDKGIRWFVRPEPLPASHKILETFRAAADAVAGARDAGAGNARTLQDIGSRVGIWMDATDATPLKTPQEVHATMTVNTSPRDQSGVPGDTAAPAAPVAAAAEEPVTEDGGPPEPDKDSPKACQVNFHPSDVGSILCCWSASAIETSPNVIIERNGKYVEAQHEVAKVEKDLADGENHKNEQCEAYEDAKKEAETAGAGQEAVEANQKASTYATGCEEARKTVNDLSNQKESWNARVMGVRGQIEAALGKAKDELKKAKGGFACVQESVEIAVPTAAETDPSSATVDRLHSFPRYLAPGNPKLIAGADSGLVEMQVPKPRHSELKRMMP